MTGFAGSAAEGPTTPHDAEGSGDPGDFEERREEKPGYESARSRRASGEAPVIESGPRPVRPRPVAPEAAEVTPSGPTVDFEWYVLRVQSGREDTVSNNLRKKLRLHGMDEKVRAVAVPKQKMTEIKEGKKRVRAQKVFPGYIFVEMALDDDLWYLIRDTTGIGDFVGSQQKPVPMASAEVRKVLDIMEEKEEPKEVKIDLHKHDAVKIKEGPFENFDGIVEEVNPQRGIVRVMVAIFGRSTPVDLEYWQVEKL
ncbi:MAG: transcription termination/antitermination protein NusG [Planctomycetota bacterium]